MSSPSPLQRRPVTVRLRSNDFGPKVRPGLLRVASKFGESPNITLVNATRFPAKFTFPPRLVQEPDGSPCDTVTVPPNSKPYDVDVNVNYSPNTVVTVEYTVCLVLFDDFCLEAAGASRPEIEIDP